MVGCLPEDLGLKSQQHINWAEWHLPVISALRREKQKDQKFRSSSGCIKFMNTKGHVHPQPTPYPLKKEKGSLLLPTFNLVRHIYPVRLSLSHMKEGMVHLKQTRGSSSKECLPPFWGKLRTQTKA